MREARCRLFSFQVLKEKYLNRRSASIFRKNTPARIVIPVNCAAMIAVPSVARCHPARRRSGRPTIPKAADPTSIGGRPEKSDRVFCPCEPRLENNRTSCLSFAPFVCLTGAFHPLAHIRVYIGGWALKTDRKQARSRTIISCRDSEWRLFGQMIPERSCPIPCSFFSMRRRRRAGRGAAQTGYPLFKRGVGREEVHEVPAGQRVDDQHMRR